MSEFIKKSRKYRFALISHSYKVAEAVRNCVNQEIEKVEIAVIKIGEEKDMAYKMLDRGAEVFFAYGATRRKINQTIDQPVVDVSRTYLDLITALIKARKHSDHIGLSSFGKPTDGVDILENLLGVKVHQFVFTNTTELIQGVENLAEDGIRVVVGGGVSKRTMEAKGGTGIINVPRKSSVELAFEDARMIADVRRKEAGSGERLRTILEMIDEGVVSVDNYGRLDNYNDRAEQILGIRMKHDIGRPSSGIGKKINLIDVITTGKPEIDIFKKINNNNIFVSSLPIQIDGDTQGAVAILKDANYIQDMSRKLKESSYQKGFVARHTVADIKHKCKQMKHLLAKAARYADTDATILIRGETGTGKELLAQSIHNLNHRKNQPFVAVNCAAIPENLLESELFGHEEGAFTGAKKGGRTGLFEMANGGTIFLDEIADISPGMQARLLRVIETKEVMRVGGDRYMPVGLHIISSTYKDLYREVRAGHFRADLFYRLSVLKLHIPPLRNRAEDIPVIIKALLKKQCKPGYMPLTPDMVEQLKHHQWQGNVRELTSFVESYLTLLNGSTADEQLFVDLFQELREQEALSGPVGKFDIENAESENTKMQHPEDLFKFSGNLKERLEKYELVIIKQMLKECQFSKKKTAEQLGVSVNTLWRKMQQFERPA